MMSRPSVAEGEEKEPSSVLPLHAAEPRVERARHAHLGRGDGLGGRNLETVLRCAIGLENTHTVIFSAGTDGIDGNSPAAGAIADGTTMARARNLGLDPAEFLARSDSYRFFAELGDLIVTGPTGTNVRDLRILIRGNQVSPLVASVLQTSS